MNKICYNKHTRSINKYKYKGGIKMGNNEKFRDDRFTYNEGEFTVELSQCHDCKSNDGIIECKTYKIKPIKYAYNEEDCPDYEDEDG